MFFAKWEEETGTVVDLSGDMGNRVADQFAVVDLDRGQRVKIKMSGADAATVQRGDRIRFHYVPAKRTKTAKKVEVLERADPAPGS